MITLSLSNNVLRAYFNLFILQNAKEKRSIFQIILQRDSYKSFAFWMINQNILDDLNDLNSEESEDKIIDQLSEEDEEGDLPQGQLSQLLTNPAFTEHMALISSIVDGKIGKNEANKIDNEAKVIQKSNQYASTITKEINTLFRSAKSTYYLKFPQLESIVTQPALYCKTVREIQRSERGETSPNFSFLSNHQKMSLQIALSTIHQSLPQEQMSSLIQNTNTAVLLHQHHNLLMMYLESCMQTVAPNLCELVGSLIASKLISAAGGIKELAAMPACNIQVLGGQRSAQIGFSQMERNHTGIFSQMELVKDAPKDYQMQLVRMLACNTAKCSRADMLKSSKGLGARLREDMYERYQKIQEEGGLHRIDKPLPIPDLQPKKKRGGKRYRKTKELYEMSEMRKQQNRLKFGEQAEEELDDGVGLGMLSQGTGKLKVQIKKQKLNASKKMTQRMNKQSGLESSLNLGASQGIQLINPDQARQSGSGQQTIFSKSAGFQTVLSNKFGSYK